MAVGVVVRQVRALTSLVEQLKEEVAKRDRELLEEIHDAVRRCQEELRLQPGDEDDDSSENRNDDDDKS